MNEVSNELAAQARNAGQHDVTWHVDEIPWTQLTGLFIQKAGYKQVVDNVFSNNAYSIELTRVGPGGSSPTHIEPHAHVFYVISGRGEVRVGDEVKEVRPGSVSPIAAGDPHSFRVLGDESLEMLVIYHPPRQRSEAKAPVPMPPTGTAGALKARVHAKRAEAEGVLSLELRPESGHSFPAFDAGAHIDVHLPNGMIRSYSLCNSAGETDRYVVGVQKDRASRGGSRYVHEQLTAGTVLEISRPRNNFRLNEQAEHSVLIAGGIGITPLLCMLRRLHALDRSVELLYCARSRGEAAFVGEIEAMGVPVSLHIDDEHGGAPDLRAFMKVRSPTAHFYACGPAPMLDAFERICRELGCARAHVERFAGRAAPASPQARNRYRVELRRSGRQLHAEVGKPLLQTLLDAGVEVEHSCTQGVCGACRTRVLAGEPDHRDTVLEPGERAAGEVMMVCVSGCKSDLLVLDL